MLFSKRTPEASSTVLASTAGYYSTQIGGLAQGGGPRLSEISCTYDPPIYDITSGCKVAALFSREAQRWTPDAIWFPRYFYPQANAIMYLECREY